MEPKLAEKTIECAPAPALLRFMIACRKDPAPMSLLLETEKSAAKLGEAPKRNSKVARHRFLFFIGASFKTRSKIDTFDGIGPGLIPLAPTTGIGFKSLATVGCRF
jgi:hypothetical protein